MRRALVGIWLLLLAVGLAGGAGAAQHHVVVLGDPHLPGKHLGAKERLRETINGWPDVELVVAVGDLCEGTGSAEELAAVREFFGRLRKPAIFLAGNHDYFYADARDADGRLVRADGPTRAAKLERFRAALGLPELYSSKRLGGYLLVFLSTDDLATGLLTKISGRQLGWLRSELTANRGLPTLIFFHAPLEGTLLPHHRNANREQFVAQPQGELKELLRQQPQVRFWVAGHMHVPATSESFRHPVNLHEGRVLGVHASDMNRARIWTTSLLLGAGGVTIRTYDHQAGAWLPELERSHPAPRP